MQCFQNCKSLTNIPSNFQLPPTAINLQSMFRNSGIHTPQRFTLPNTTTNITYLFDSCSNLTTTPPGMFDYNPIIDSYDYLFNNCTSLTNIDETFKYLNTVKSSAYTFNNCKLTEIPQTIILPNELSNIEYCFNNNTTLTTIHSNFKFPTSLRNLRYCFNNCTSLLSIPETIWPEISFDVETTINIQRTFNNCKLATGMVPKYKLWKGEIYWNPLSEVAPLNPMTFNGCIKLDNYEYIPKHWGGLGKDEESFDIGIETTEENEVFALPIHKTYDTFNYTTGERITKIAEYDFIVNWGDGTTSTIIASGNDTNLWNTTARNILWLP